jgi:hypothetical protein
MAGKLEIHSSGQLTENPHMLRRLVYVKSLYLQGFERYSSDTELDRAIALLHYDNSIEMLMNATIEYLGGQMKGDKFDDLLAAFKVNVQKIISNPSKLIHEPEIKNMRKARNVVQHHGIIPSSSDLDRYTTLTKMVLNEVIKEVFNIDFADISLSMLIKDEVTKTLYAKAETAYSFKNYKEALIYSASAFEFAKNKEQGRIFGSTLSHYRDKKGTRDVEKLLMEEIEVLKLRLDYKKYQNYRQIFSFSIKPFTQLNSFLGSDVEHITQETSVIIKKAIESWQNLKPDKMIENVRFCIDFTLEAILRWEAVPRKAWWELNW